jgi:hypothetical protein
MSRPASSSTSTPLGGGRTPRIPRNVGRRRVNQGGSIVTNPIEVQNMSINTSQENVASLATSSSTDSTSNSQATVTFKLMTSENSNQSIVGAPLNNNSVYLRTIPDELGLGHDISNHCFDISDMTFESLISLLGIASPYVLQYDPAYGSAAGVSTDMAVYLSGIEAPIVNPENGNSIYPLMQVPYIPGFIANLGGIGAKPVTDMTYGKSTVKHARSPRSGRRSSISKIAEVASVKMQQVGPSTTVNVVYYTASELQSNHTLVLHYVQDTTNYPAVTITLNFVNVMDSSQELFVPWTIIGNSNYVTILTAEYINGLLASNNMLGYFAQQNFILTYNPNSIIGNTYIIPLQPAITPQNIHLNSISHELGTVHTKGVHSTTNDSMMDHLNVSTLAVHHVGGSGGSMDHLHSKNDTSSFKKLTTKNVWVHGDFFTQGDMQMNQSRSNYGSVLFGRGPTNSYTGLFVGGGSSGNLTWDSTTGYLNNNQNNILTPLTVPLASNGVSYLTPGTWRLCIQDGTKMSYVDLTITADQLQSDSTGTVTPIPYIISILPTFPDNILPLEYNGLHYWSISPIGSSTLQFDGANQQLYLGLIDEIEWENSYINGTQGQTNCRLWNQTIALEGGAIISNVSGSNEDLAAVPQFIFQNGSEQWRMSVFPDPLDGVFKFFIQRFNTSTGQWETMVNYQRTDQQYGYTS